MSPEAYVWLHIRFGYLAHSLNTAKIYLTFTRFLGSPQLYVTCTATLSTTLCQKLNTQSGNTCNTMIYDQVLYFQVILSFELE